MLKEQHPFWSAWANVVIRRPVIVILIAAAVGALFAYQTWKSPKDLSFTGIISEAGDEMDHFRETIDEFGTHMMLVILLEGERAEINRAIDLLQAELPKLADVKAVSPPPDPNWLIDRAPWVWPRPIFDTALRAAESGDVPDSLLTALDGADQTIHQALQPVERAAMIGITLNRSPLDMAMGGRDYYVIEEKTISILEDAKLDLTYGFTGLAAAAAQDQRSVMFRIKVLTPLTLVIVLFLLMGVERRLSRVLLAGIALSFAVLIAFGLVGITLGRLSITVTFFGMLLLGLGIDFGIHLLVSLRDARSHGKTPEESIRHGIRHTATAIALGGISSALAFGLVALVPEPGTRDMGFAALYGLLAALVLMLTFLPASWLVLERRHANLDAPPRFNLPGLHGLVSLSLRFPRTVLLIGLTLTLIGIAGIPHYKLERDLQKIISRKVTAFSIDDRISELYGASPVSYIAPIESLEQARQLAAKLPSIEGVQAIRSTATIILPDAEERLRRVNAILDAPGGGKRTGPVMDRLRRARDLGIITTSNIPPPIGRGVIGITGKLAVSIQFKENIRDADVLTEHIADLRTVAPTATGMPVLIKLVAMGTRDYIPIMITGIVVVVTIVLLIAFRSPRDVMLALLPVVVGTAVAFGVYLWFGLQMTILTSVVVPVILGLGVDDGIHVVERLRQYKFRNDEILHEAVESVGRAIFLTTATTCVSFITLLFTDHAGLESVARFMLIGIPACFITSVTLIPAAAKLMNNENPDPQSETPRSADH